MRYWLDDGRSGERPTSVTAADISPVALRLAARVVQRLTMCVSVDSTCSRIN